MQEVILALIYLVIGFILSVPYTYLAGGNSDNLLMTAYITPVAALFLFIANAMRGIGQRDGKRPKWGGGVFWVLVAYFCLPILLNGASLLLKKGGQEQVGHYIFEGRYFSLLAVPVLLILYGVVVGGVMSIRQWFSGNATPPSSTPPSGFGPNKTAAISPSEESKTDPGTF